MPENYKSLGIAYMDNHFKEHYGIDSNHVIEGRVVPARRPLKFSVYVNSNRKQRIIILAGASEVFDGTGKNRRGLAFRQKGDYLVRGKLLDGRGAGTLTVYTMWWSTRENKWMPSKSTKGVMGWQYYRYLGNKQEQKFAACSSEDGGGTGRDTSVRIRWTDNRW